MHSIDQRIAVDDVFAASGRLLMVLAKRSVGSCNYLGIDIRDKVCADLLETHINLCSIEEPLWTTSLVLEVQGLLTKQVLVSNLGVLL